MRKKKKVVATEELLVTQFCLKIASITEKAKEEEKQNETKRQKVPMKNTRCVCVTKVEKQVRNVTNRQTTKGLEHGCKIIQINTTVCLQFSSCLKGGKKRKR